MKYLNIKKARVYQAVLLEKFLPRSALHKIVGVGFFVIILAAAATVFIPKIITPQKSFGVFLISATVTLAFWIYTLFFETYLDIVQTPGVNDENAGEFLDFETIEIVEEFLDSKNHDLSALLLPILKVPGAQFIFYRSGVSPKNVTENLQEYLKNFTKPATDAEVLLFLQDAWEDKVQSGTNKPLSWRDLLVTLCVHSEFLRKFIFEMHLEKKDIRALADWQAEIDEDRAKAKKFWSRDVLMHTRGIGKDWASGYTLNLDKFARDITQLVFRRGFAPHLYGRSDETEAIERILARAGENNVVLVGEEGVGKKTITYALARKISLGETLVQLAHKRVLQLDVGAILAGATSEHDIEGRLKLVLNDAVRAGNVILLIEEIHSLFSRSHDTGTVNATEILLPYLNSSLFQVIGLTNYRAYEETIAKNSSLQRVFEKVEVKEPNKNQVFEIIRDVTPRIEGHSQVLILYQAIKQAIALADRYIKNVPFPEKAIDVLQEAAVYAQTKARSSVVTAEHVEEVVHRKTEIPVGQIALAEKDVLLNLEKVLHRKVIGQEEAIVAISNAMRRSRSGISSEKKPIGSFLFLGPTGVGKTETAKALASVYFGSEKRMIRFDMSEYQQADSINRLIGHDAESGQLTVSVTESPFSLVLLDEIEKAHPNILNLFLQVLDDGRLTDSLGRTVDFTNTIIIATSNAGAEVIRESVKQFREANLKERLLDYLQKQGIFRPEFLNRFDAAIIFRPLTEEQTREVVELLLTDFNRRLQAKDVSIAVTPEVIKKVAELGYDPEFGARPLRRVIQDRLENLVAKKLLSGELQRGDKMEIKAEEI